MNWIHNDGSVMPIDWYDTITSTKFSITKSKWNYRKSNCI